MDARRALLSRLFDHAAMFPPASLPLGAALAEDDRARGSEHAWLLGRFVVPEGVVVENREVAVVGGGIEEQGEVRYVGGHTKVRCGGTRVPSVEELAAFVRGCRERGLVFKATAGLHHAYPTAEGAFDLDERSFRWDGRDANGAACARVRETLLRSIGTCSFCEPAGELVELGIL